MKKSRMHIGLALAGLMLFAGNLLAGGGGFQVPDGGSSALLLGVSIIGLKAARGLLR